MCEKEYRAGMERIHASASLRERTAERMLEALEREKAVHPVRRPLTLLLSALLFLALSVSVLAAAVPSFREFLFGPDSGLAEHLQEVQASTVDDGIRMDVLGTVNDQNNFAVYFTLTDESGEHRLNPDMEVNLWPRLNNRFPPQNNVLPDDTDFAVEIMDFAEETNTLLCRFLFAGPIDVSGADLLLSIKEIRLMEETCEKIELPEMAYTEETIPASKNYLNKEKEWFGSASFHTSYLDESGKLAFLKPVTDSVITVPDAEYFGISAWGYVNGVLRIQTGCDISAGIDELAGGLIRCTDKGGEAPVLDSEHPSGLMISFEESKRLAYKMAGNEIMGFDYRETAGEAEPPLNRPGFYCEQVFEIPEKELGNYDFYACTGRKTMSLTGNWRISLKLGNGSQTVRVLTGLEMENGAVLERLEITPMGIYVSGSRAAVNSVKEVELTCDGEETEYLLAQRSTESLHRKLETYSAKFIAKKAPADLSKAESLMLNGKMIPLQ